MSETLLAPDDKQRNTDAEPRYALVSMPWFWAYLPSLQLAIVKDLLEQEGVQSDTFEFYVDFVDRVGAHTYKVLANDSGYAGELLFSQFYFDDFGQQYRTDRPSLGIGSKELEDSIFVFMTPVIEAFLDKCYAQADWSDYDVVCFSLTSAQTSASMAMAKRIKRNHPHIKIVMGGTSCAGAMGSAIARMCSEVDVIAHSEAEMVVPPLVEALSGRRPLDDVPGITYRREDGSLATTQRAKLHDLARKRGVMNFDAFFKRVENSETLKRLGPWIPFESSRGCWYGEKVQCTFCGLNEIIQYRDRGDDGLLKELETYEERYGVSRFFAVDLIMPRSFFKGFLPEVERAKKDWTIFYEIKSNMRREEIEQLSRGRVAWIQPGIESLDDDVLRLMKKGVTAAHNIQTLKWTRELGIKASWNLITGFPGERADSYFDMARLFPKLHHLLPPVGFGDFEVHRFSPYFEKPDQFNITLEGAHPNYAAVFPVDQSVLDDLVYRYDYQLNEAQDPDLNAARKAALDAVDAWRKASAQDRTLTFERLSSWAIRVFDSRADAQGVAVTLTGPEASLFEFLDEIRPETRVLSLFKEHDSAAHAQLGGDAGVAKLIGRWESQDLILRLSGYVQGLAIRQHPDNKAETMGELAAMEGD